MERNLFVDFIIDETADFFMLTPSQIKLPTRRKEIAIPRQVAMYMIKHFDEDISHLTIAEHLGLTNHSTSIHGIDKVKEVVDNPYLDKLLHRKVKDLTQTIENKISNGQLPKPETFEQVLDRETEDILSYTWDVEIKNKIEEVEE